MKGQFFTILLIATILFGVDMYLENGFKAAFKKRGFVAGTRFKQIYIAFSLALILGTMVSIYFKIPVGVRAGILMVFFVLSVVKLTFLPFVLIDDVRRIIIRFKKPEAVSAFPNEVSKEKIPRSEFLMRAGLITGVVPLAAIGVGISSGAYDYRVRYQTLNLPNLPKAFDGMTIGQISDIHSGSFYNK